MVGQKRLALLLVSLLVLAGCAARQPGATEPETEGGGDPPVPPGNYRFDSYARVLVEGTLDRLPREILYLSSAVDGTDIEITVWRPDTAEPVPVLVDAGPYFEPAGAVPAFSNGWASESGHVGRLITNFVPHGYAVAAVAVRGTAGSGGCMDLMGPMEVADLDQAITWLGTQDWSNGNVAMLGKSYDGSTPWQVAGTGNPHLKTIVPMSGVPDIYELMFRNGTAEIRGPFLLNALYYSFALRQPATEVAQEGEIQDRTRRTVEGLSCPDHVEGMLAPLYSGVDGGRDPFGFWAERNLKPGVEANYKGSILHVQGLQDWNVDPALNLPWVDELNRSGLHVHQMLGQWGHSYPDDANDGPNARWDWAQILLNWFDRWLKEDETAPLGPAVQVLDMDGRWRVEDAWPPRDARWLPLNLSADGALVHGDAAAGEFLLVPQAVSPGMFTPAVAPSAVPGASADFRLEVDDDTLIAGLPLVHVDIVPYGAGGSLAAYLYSVDENGLEQRIGHTQINLRFAHGGSEPQDVTPGETLRVKMQIQPMDAVVPAGNDLLLRIWSYRDDANGDAVQGRLPSLPQSPIMLQVGGASDSAMRLPTIERGEDVYFQPPLPQGGA